MAITASQIRGIFGEYVPFVFELVCGLNSHISLYEPDGGKEMNISVVRNRVKTGLFTSFTTNLGFIKADADWINAIISTSKYEGNIILNVYELDIYAMDYVVIHSGILDLSKYEKSNERLKIPVLDTDLLNYIEKFGDTEFSLTDEDLNITTPVYKCNARQQDFLFNGIGLHEYGEASAVSDWVTIPQMPQPQNVVFVRPKIEYQIKDTENSLYTDTEIEYKLPYGYNDWTNGGLPLFTSDVNGGEFGINIKMQFNLNWFEGLGATAIKVAVLYAGQDFFNLPSAQVVFYQTYNPYAGVTTVAIDDNVQLFLPPNTEVYLTFAMDRELGNTYYPSVKIRSNIELIECMYRGYPTTRLINHSPFWELVKATLNKMTNGDYWTISTPIDNNILFTTTIVNGNFLRGFDCKTSHIDDAQQRYSLNVTFNDLMDFAFKTCSLGYEIVNNVLVFKNQYKFFDLTKVTKQLTEVSNFSEKAFTDFYYNSIKTGFKDYSTEFLGGKYDMFAESEFRTPVNSVKNELNLIPNISANAFEIDEQVRRGLRDIDLHDFDGDNTLYAIKIDANTMDRVGYDFAESQIFPYCETIFNLQFTPFRNLERHKWILKNSIPLETDMIKCIKRAKNENYYSKIGSDSVLFEKCDFFTETQETLIGTVIVCEPQKLEPVSFEFLAPLSAIDWAYVIANKDGLILFTNNGQKFAGFLDDFSRNPSTNDAKNIKLIKAHLTESQIEALWQ